MRIWIFSDLHTDATPWTPPADLRADIAIIAGDVADGLTRRAIPWLQEHACPRVRKVVYVPGNHDYWRCRMPDEIARAHEDAAAAGIALLDAGQHIDIEGIRIVGATMWTDYAITGSRPTALAIAGDRRGGMRDHRLIQTRDSRGTPAPFRPLAAAELHRQHRARIEAALAEPWPGPRLVVSHHAPHPRSLLHGQVTEQIDAAYASDLSSILEGATAPDVWVHGHIHRSADYRVGRTRVIANPRGHDTSHRRRDGSWVSELENPAFDPSFTVEI